MRTFQKILMMEKIPAVNIRLLVIGRTGHGKSTLINSIIEQCREISPEGARRNSCTTKSRSFTYPDVIPGINVTLIDSPGLQHANGEEQKYIQELKSECKEISLVLYCTNMKDFRTTKSDKDAIQKLHQAFGSNFWKRVVFVLTFANEENCARRDDRDGDESHLLPWKEVKKNRFKNRVKLSEKGISNFVNECLGINEDFEAVPAGCYQKDGDFSDDPNDDLTKLPDGEDWLHNTS
ncbi:PREDICTED: immune-associated nucleotide-binding protein 12-like [Amphimedon queenslandica]|uniref:AIG1-type G domain-containing protein n=1 Tax=Amphimedon queenslandica TaxID=400682 RepID=A0A1X7T655_AMPQE|nr:PREDICTED: immune-associated nucleotide-binding protein 12-like [Amphimedon queenslandica]|eukprot:XP_011408155.2 PREDICTED: immune-associated nucleotide-binding protein 12-like [Amphimedon queenslandica]